ncbi:hypothetical protein [Streptosporangium sp. NPDC002721]|uniref:hypothetical protein n=1 Tax=Streptosporangium sp. NPDC002721 TaxID=3366188 RepID=UPI0036908E5D
MSDVTNARQGSRRFDDIARAMVEEVSPDEARVYPAVAAAVRRDPRRVLGPGRDDALGFGLAEAATLIAPIVITILSDVVTNSLTNATERQASRWWQRWRGRGGKKREQVAAGEAEVPVLRPEAAEAVGKELERLALDLKVDPDVALRLRQSMYGYLSGQR